jgi:hypothetical protein
MSPGALSATTRLPDPQRSATMGYQTGDLLDAATAGTRALSRETLTIDEARWPLPRRPSQESIRALSTSSARSHGSNRQARFRRDRRLLEAVAEQPTLRHTRDRTTPARRSTLAPSPASLRAGYFPNDGCGAAKDNDSPSRDGPKFSSGGSRRNPPTPVCFWEAAATASES